MKKEDEAELDVKWNWIHLYIFGCFRVYVNHHSKFITMILFKHTIL